MYDVDNVSNTIYEQMPSQILFKNFIQIQISDI